MDPQGYLALEKNAPAKTPTSGEKVLRLNASTEDLDLVSGDGSAVNVPTVPKYADNSAATAGGLSSGDYYWDTTNAKLALVT